MATETLPYQVFTKGAVLMLGGKKFTVDFVGEATAWATHGLIGARGGAYYLVKYLSKDGMGTLYYIVSQTGANDTPLRDKFGRKIHAHLIGDIISDATA